MATEAVDQDLMRLSNPDGSLLTAVTTGNTDLLKKVLEDGRCNVNCVDPGGNSPLHLACLLGRTDMVRLLKLADANLIDAMGNTPLHTACSRGDIDTVNVLISELIADTSIQNNLGYTGLMLAVAGGHDTMVHALLFEHRWPVDDTRDKEGNTVLHLACMQKGVKKLTKEQVAITVAKITAAIKLPDNYGSPQPGLPKNFMSLLRKKFVAAVLDDSESTYRPIVDGVFQVMFRYLQNNNAGEAPEASEAECLSIVTTILEMPLIKQLIAILKKQFSTPPKRIADSIVIDLVRKCEANLSTRNKANNTPLHMAAGSGKLDVVQTLLKEFNCNVGERGYSDRSVLHFACLGGSIPLVRALIREHGADLNDRDRLKSMPLHLAALQGNNEMVSCLVREFDCDINVVGQSGRSLLHYACMSGNIDLVKMLILEHKADIHAKDDASDTPLHIAALSGQKEVAMALIQEFGCDVEVKGAMKRSLLHKACNGGNISLVKTLIRNYQADIYARDEKNDTPIHVAVFCGRYEVVLCLLNEFQCDVNVRGQAHRTLLHHVAQRGNINMVRLLIRSHNADVNAQDDESLTPFHLAILNSKSDVYLSLLNEFHCNWNFDDLLMYLAIQVGKNYLHRLFAFLTQYFKLLLTHMQENKLLWFAFLLVFLAVLVYYFL